MNKKYFFFLIISDDLLADQTSFIYGQSPSTGNIPIYAKVTICNSAEFDNELEGKDAKSIYSKRNWIFLF